VKRLLVLLGVALLLAGCGGSSPSPPAPLPAALAQRFHYDRTAPTGLRDRGLANHGYPVKIHDVRYPGPNGDSVLGYLMVPPGKGPFPGVVFLPGAGSTREAWLVPAVDLASRGAVTLVIATPFISGQNQPSGLAGALSFRAGFIQNVLDVRRALDVLAARPDVDPTRLGLVGHSLGAELVAVAGGVDSRTAALVLIAPPQHPHFNPPLSPDVQRQASSLLATIDPTGYLPYTRADVLLSLARQDQVVPRSEYDAVVAAAPSGRTVRWYDTDHNMSPAAVDDTMDWLADELDLGPLPGYARRARAAG